MGKLGNFDTKTATWATIFKLPKFNSNTELKAFVRSVDDFVNDNFQLKSAFNVNMEQLKKIYDSMSDTVKLFAKDIKTGSIEELY